MSNTVHESEFQKVHIGFSSKEHNALNALNSNKQIDFSKTNFNVTDVVEYSDISDVTILTKFGHNKPKLTTVSGDSLSVVKDPSLWNEERISGIIVFEGSLSLDANDTLFRVWFRIYCSKLTGLCTASITKILIDNENQASLSHSHNSSFNVPSIVIKLMSANILAKFSEDIENQMLRTHN